MPTTISIPECWLTSATTTVGTQVWTLWNTTTGVTSVTSATTDVWPIWINTAGTALVTNNPWQPRQRTAEEMVADAARAESYRAERVKADGERQLARQKAQLLLDQHLSEKQRSDLAAKGHFELTTIHSQSGERRRYRINRGRAGNVERIDENGKRLSRYCIHPVINCPDEDTMLTQKLWLETNEELFLRTANRS